MSPWYQNQVENLRIKFNEDRKNVDVKKTTKYPWATLETSAFLPDPILFRPKIDLTWREVQVRLTLRRVKIGSIPGQVKFQVDLTWSVANHRTNN